MTAATRHQSAPAGSWGAGSPMDARLQKSFDHTPRDGGTDQTYILSGWQGFQTHLVWLVQMERGNEHDADVAGSQQDALSIIYSHLQSSITMPIERSKFLMDEDYRELVRARAGAIGIFYTIEQRRVGAR